MAPGRGQPAVQRFDLQWARAVTAVNKPEVSTSTRQRPGVDRSDVRRALGLIIIGSLGMQASSAIALGLFDSLGPLPVSSLRMVIAAILLCAVFRPRLAGRTRTQWTGIVVYGIAMSAIIGVSIPYAVDTVAARVSSARVVGTLFSMDPVVGSVVGLLFLGQAISAEAAIGVLLVAVAGAAIVWMSDTGQRVP
jgi:inner membrane transporter RhtA